MAIRLFDLFKPNNYKIYLDINRATKEITGSTTITGEAVQQKIALHQKGLNIKNVTVDEKNVAFSDDVALEAFWIELGKTGAVTIKVDYTSKLTDTMMGIYPSYYELNGERKQIIGTQFETTAARQAFPGVDEPAAKATFDIALKYDEVAGETTLSNMPEQKVVDGVHYFDTTVKMSTYLVAFAFGDLRSKLTETKSGVKIGVFATKAHAEKELDFALDIAKRSIEFYEDFYHTPYPLPHSWQLALPDFSAGAMENWGLVTYREAYLVLDPDNTSIDTKQVVATVIAHELAHQWFGDLVTMQWWDDLWLNESFANMMEYVAIDALEPSWKIWDLFQVTEAPAALQRDATDGVQSVHVQVEDPAEIDSIFDGAIVYAKGSRMLVMVRSLIGDDALRSGLKNYFIKHSFGNAKGADLWDALSDASGIDVGAIMNSWLEQPGYPVVTAAVIDGQLKITQQQFFIGENTDAGRKWQVPLNANYSAAPKIFKDGEATIGDYDELRREAGTPFRLNVGNESHFIVKYSADLLTDILSNVADLDEIGQYQLLEDLRLLAEGNEISYAELVPTLVKFKESHSYIVIQALYDILNSLTKFVEPDSEEEKNLQAYQDQMSQNQIARLGILPVAGEAIDDQLIRPLVLNASIFGKNPATLAKAHDIFVANKDDLGSLDADVRVYILANEMKNYSSKELFTEYLSAYRSATDQSFKQDLAAATYQIPETEQLKEIVELYKDATTIKPQNLRQWFRGVLGNPKGQQVAWDWMRTEWGWLEETVGGDMEFTTYITVAASVFHTAKRLAEFKEFFEPKINQPGLGREITMDVKVIESKVKLIEREKNAINAAIKEAITK